MKSEIVFERQTRLFEGCMVDLGTPEPCESLREPGSPFCAEHKAEGERLLSEER